MCEKCRDQFGFAPGDYAASRTDLRDFEIIEMGKEPNTFICQELNIIENKMGEIVIMHRIDLVSVLEMSEH